jgi:pimeloyl-ACP methyl ester carboxylesterase
MKNDTYRTDYTSTWLPNSESKHLTLNNGATLRYIETGRGEPLLLIHNMRTQLDYFQKLVPLLRDKYRLILIDLPGHGYSSIDPESTQDEPYFRQAIIEAIGQLGLKRLSIGGESIGASLALTIAATLPKGRVTHVYALNPYDYGEHFGGGLRRSKFGFIISLFKVFRQWTMESPLALKLVLSGGFAKGRFEPEHFLRELVRTGGRKGYRRAEYLLYKNWRSWLAAKELYVRVLCPVSLVYGEQDWAGPAEREANRQLIKPVHFETLPNTGHFSALENPDAVANILGPEAYVKVG